MAKWISVKKRLPEKSGVYVVKKDFGDDFYDISVLSYSVKHKVWNAHDWDEQETANKLRIDKVTHWAPIMDMVNIEEEI